MDTLDEIRRKQSVLKNTAASSKALNVRTHSSVTSVLEGVLARGDRKLGPVIERAYRNGAKFDSWDEHLRLDFWEEAFEHFQIDRSKYLGTIPVTARLPWLVLNLFTETVAVSAIAIFQSEIAKVVALAVLMPIVSSLGGNAGTQTLAVAVRALASRELNSANAKRIIMREVGVGLTNGLVLALVMGVAVFGFYHNIRLSLTVGLALIANIFIAALGGILAPLALEKMGRDPAVSSSIFVTFLTDFVGFLAVLALAALILL